MCQFWIGHLIFPKLDLLFLYYCVTIGLPYNMTAQCPWKSFYFFSLSNFPPPPSPLTRCDWPFVIANPSQHVTCSSDWPKPPDLRRVPALSPTEDRFNMAASVRCFLRSGKVWNNYQNTVLCVIMMCDSNGVSLFSLLQNAVSALGQRGFHKSAPAAVQVSVSS